MDSKSVMNPRQFVTQKSLTDSGGYTVVPVFRGKYLDLPFHVKRLTDSYRCISQQSLLTYENVAYSVLEEIHNQKLISPSSNGFLTVIISSSLSQYSLDYHIDSLFSDSIISDLINIEPPSLLLQPHCDTIIETFPYQRHQPYCKDIQWPQQRLFIEKQKKISNSHEIILKHEGKYLEGLTSNMFAMDSNAKTIYSCISETDVLPGSMARLFIAFCRAFRKDIQLIEDIPITNDILSTCDSLFLTSATKPIFPIFKLFDFYSSSTLPTSSSSSSSTLDSIHIQNVQKRELSFQKSNLLIELKQLFLLGLRNACEDDDDDDDEQMNCCWLAPSIPYPLWWSSDNIPMISRSTSAIADLGNMKPPGMDLYPNKAFLDSTALLTKYVNLI